MASTCFGVNDKRSRKSFKRRKRKGLRSEQTRKVGEGTLFGPARTEQLLRDSGDEDSINENLCIQHADGGVSCY